MINHQHTIGSAYNKSYLRDNIQRLLNYCRQNKWAGYDPYDALNSNLFKIFPFLNYKVPRLIFTQLLKRVPFNCRHILLIEREQNPKALGLFLSSFIKLSDSVHLDEDDIAYMVKRLKDLRSPNSHYWSWGYTFPWQTRTLLVPKRAPNLVCTIFVAESLLDLFEYQNDPLALKIALSSADYIADELYWHKGDIHSFKYPTPASYSRVHNANLLASAFLSRAYQYGGPNKYVDIALKTALYSCYCQRDDGAWYYGEHKTQAWVDNFHTGYNLMAIDAIIRYTGNEDFKPILEKGLHYYTDNFFSSNNIPKYFDCSLYPIDIHCIAQSIITLQNFADRDIDYSFKIRDILDWSFKHLLDDDGYFYYQITPYYRNKVSFMRWSQAWMLYALSSVYSAFNKNIR